MSQAHPAGSCDSCAPVQTLWTVLMDAPKCIVENCDEILWCYYDTAAVYRPSKGQFDLEEHLNPHICTHLLYGFMGVNSSTGSIEHLHPDIDLPYDGGRDYFGKLKTVKQINPKLKIILSVGGWQVKSKDFSIMAHNARLRSNFIASALKMVQDNHFDGLDLAWIFPNYRDSFHGVKDIKNFSLLVKELYEEFSKNGLLVTAAVAPWRWRASNSYNVPEISKYLDYISIMAFEYHLEEYFYLTATRHVAPLYRGMGMDEYNDESLHTVEAAFKYWTSQGCPREKIIIGVPFYGLTFVLADPKEYWVGVPVAGTGFSGPYINKAGNIGYNELCHMLLTENWIHGYDKDARGNYEVSVSDWVSYDDNISLIDKVSFARSSRVAGIMVWTIDTDDFRGICNRDGVPFSLLNTIYRNLYLK